MLNESCPFLHVAPHAALHTVCNRDKSTQDSSLLYRIGLTESKARYIETCVGHGLGSDGG